MERLHAEMREVLTDDEIAELYASSRRSYASRRTSYDGRPYVPADEIDAALVGEHPALGGYGPGDYSLGDYGRDGFES